ncbi:TPA: hypothetical protein TX926_000579 [Streptococcus suis]|nr:hypothetical protein [Streptococcus suis]HEL1894173.1 hypothetical protein [Streptococcus suis]
MKFLNMMKQFFGLYEDSTQAVTLSDNEQKWKNLALELNAELQQTRKLYKHALEECVRLQAICDCQSELLAERQGQ